MSTASSSDWGAANISELFQLGAGPNLGNPQYPVGQETYWQQQGKGQASANLRGSLLFPLPVLTSTPSVRSKEQSAFGLMQSVRCRPVHARNHTAGDCPHRHSAPPGPSGPRSL